MFISIPELKTVIQEYQVYDLTDNDDSIIATSIATGIEEVKSYLTPSFKKEWLDGRVRYDAEAIFAKTGDDRNVLILEHTKNVAMWYLIRRNNAEIIYQHVKDRYDSTVKFLTQLQRGEITIASLPLKPTEQTTVNRERYRFGSKPKQDFWE